jgi:eukaryotic-like serine/threonine-protein kinase
MAHTVGEGTGSPVTIAPDRLREALAERSLALERELGRGGMATVYLARDLRHDRLVAVKVLRPEVSMGAARFAREIEAVSHLAHPNIVPLYDSGMVDGAPYYVMPYIEGDSLRQLLRRQGRLSISESVRVAGEIGEALEFAHSHGIIHRDIKPENVLLHARHALVTDFGVARALSSVAQIGADGDRLTEVGRILGTAEYMSPEQASGDATLDGRSDVYSLGCVLYEMLTGQPPFTGGSTREILSRRFRESPPDVRKQRPEVPPAIGQVIAKSLAPDPAARYGSAREFLEALHGAATGAAEPGITISASRAWSLARWWIVAVAVLGALALYATRSRSFDPTRVVVARMSNETGDSTLSYLGPLATDHLTAALANTPGVHVVVSATIIPSRVNSGVQVDSLDDPARLRRLADETAAGTLVSGSYFRDDGRLSFQAEITDANRGTLLKALGPISLPARRVEEAVDSLSRSVAHALRPIAGSSRRVP